MSHEQAGSLSTELLLPLARLSLPDEPGLVLGSSSGLAGKSLKARQTLLHRASAARSLGQSIRRGWRLPRPNPAPGVHPPPPKKKPRILSGQIACHLGCWGMGTNLLLATAKHCQ